MSYIKTTWVEDETVVDATKMNNIENGIENTNGRLVNIGASVDSSYRTNILHSKNLFNKATVVVGYYKNANGTPIVDNTACYSELIQVDTTKQYYSNKTISIVYYNSSKQPVGTLTGTFTGAFTPTYPYIVINVLQVDLDTFQLEKGSSATSYEPYITPSIVVDNEEIYNKDNIEQYSTNEIRIGTWVDGKPLYRKVVKTVMGTCTTNGTYGTSNRYTVDTNAEIKNFYGTIPLGGGIFPILYVDSGGRFTKVASDDGKTLVLSTNAVFFSGANCEITVEYTKTTD